MAAIDDDGPMHGPCETCEGSGIYRLKSGEKISAASYLCPNCGAESFNINDVRERYCGRCHVFEDDAA